MSRFQLNRVLFVLFGVAAVLVAVTVAQATPITFSGIYDGSYDPYTASPPPGQSTWHKGSATLNPVPNSDSGTASPGVAAFTDASTSERLNMNRTYADGNTFSSNQTDDEYFYEARIKFYGAGGYSQSQYSVASVGFRDEYNGTASGKTVMLGWIPSYPSPGTYMGLWFVTNSTKVTDVGAIKISNTNYFDVTWHTYRVEKYIDGYGIAQVDVLVDGTLLGTYAYSSLPNATATTEGFGWYGSSLSRSDATVDYINYAGIPEPGTLALLATGLIGLLCYAWRKRK